MSDAGLPKQPYRPWLSQFRAPPMIMPTSDSDTEAPPQLWRPIPTYHRGRYGFYPTSEPDKIYSYHYPEVPYYHHYPPSMEYARSDGPFQPPPPPVPPRHNFHPGAAPYYHHRLPVHPPPMDEVPCHYHPHPPQQPPAVVYIPNDDKSDDAANNNDNQNHMSTTPKSASSTSATSYFDTVTDKDVLCGRGAPSTWHPGNQYFRSLVEQYQTKYLAARRADKPDIAIGVVQGVTNTGGRFLKRVKIPGKGFAWQEIGHQRAYEKACQALREGAPEIRRQLLLREEARDDCEEESAL